MNILNIFFNIFFYFCFQTRLCCESSQTEDYQCVCMHGCMYVYVCVCVCIYIYVGSPPSSEKSRNTSILTSAATESTLFCLFCDVTWRYVVWKFEHVAMPQCRETRSIAIANEKIQSCTTSADTSAGEVSLLVLHNDAYLPESKGRRVYDWTANKQPFCSQVLLAMLRIPLVGREVPVVESSCLSSGRSLVKCTSF